MIAKQPKAVIFDLFETLVTQYDPLFKERIQIHEISTLPEEIFLTAFAQTAKDRHNGAFKTRIDAYRFICQKHGGELIPEQLEKYEDWARDRKAMAFNKLDSNVTKMLTGLKKRGVKTALITDCEYYDIEYYLNSTLPTLVRNPLFSCRVGLTKPDKEIYERALIKLDCQAHECIYLGDGGSHELQGAQKAGIKAYQANWFLKQFDEEFRKKADQPFPKIDEPEQVLELIDT